MNLGFLSRRVLASTVVVVFVGVAFAGSASAFQSNWHTANPAFDPQSNCTFQSSRTSTKVLASGCDQAAKVRGKFREFGILQTTSWSPLAAYASRTVPQASQQRMSNEA